MKNILNFLIDVGQLKGKARRGWELHRIKDPETTAEHIFSLAILVWALGKEKKINLERAIKMALLHDLCEVYARDLTPYDPLLPDNKKDVAKILKTWPKFTPQLKKKKEIQKYKEESRCFNRLVSHLPKYFQIELNNLWTDYSQGLTKEARFVKQADKMINFLQGIEYWKKYGKIQHKLWTRWIKETIDDPILIKFIGTIEDKFF